MGALLVLLDSMLLVQRERIADLAAKNRLPTVYGLRWHAEAGGLMAYGANLLDMVRRIAGFVDRILKGAKPADLPWSNPPSSSWSSTSRRRRRLVSRFRRRCSGGRMRSFSRSPTGLCPNCA